MTAPKPEPSDEEQLDEAEWRRRQRVLNQPAIDLLDSWAEATEEERAEQRETWELLKQALDEDRLSYRKLFS